MSKKNKRRISTLCIGCLNLKKGKCAHPKGRQLDAEGYCKNRIVVLSNTTQKGEYDDWT